MGERYKKKIYGSLWRNSNEPGTPGWMFLAPLFMLIVIAVGCFGLQFLGWAAR